MSRVADSTIKGFLYQFNLTLKNLFELPSDKEIQVEGIIEDIDILSNDDITAIQCKYHESQEKFKLSSIYKPVLQMLKNYSLKPDSKIKYILYAFFPSLSEGSYNLTKENLVEMLNTNNLDYICNYIVFIKPCADQEIKTLIEKTNKTIDDKKKIKEYYDKNSIEVSCDLDLFLASKFKFEIGKSYQRIEDEVKQLLINEQFSPDDVKDIFYPNAIQKIAEISTIRVDKNRIINKKWLIENLKKTKKTAITRWTKELTDYKNLLKTRRKQLSFNLNENYRKRCFIIDDTGIENFDDNIVIFLKDYTNMYCKKVKLHRPATFCIHNYTKNKVDDLVSRLYAKDVIAENGYRGNLFFKDAFVKEPETKISENWMQFKLRISNGMEDVYSAINNNKPDDLFVIGSDIPSNLDLKDVNLEILDVKSLSELKYLLKLESEVK